VEKRTAPLSEILVIDVSKEMGNGLTEAETYLRNAFFRGTVQTGDTVTIIKAGAKPELLCDSLEFNAANAPKIDGLLAGLKPEAGEADLNAALAEAAALGSSARYDPYVSLASAPGAKGLPKYARTLNFGHWHFSTVGVGLEGEVNHLAETAWQGMK
jgi:hypothetical protein